MTFKTHIGIPIDDIERKYLEVDLGNGHTLSPLDCTDGTYFGLLWCHPPADNFYPEGEEPQCGYPVLHCESVLMFEGPVCHRVTAVLPMWISPSLVCTTCGAHGFCDNGRYIDISRPHRLKNMFSKVTSIFG